MSARFGLAALAATMWLSVGLVGEPSAPGVLLRDDFDGDFPDPAVWTYQRRDWLLGLTQLDLPPIVLKEGTTSFVRLTQHSYNPNDPGGSLRSTEFLTREPFGGGGSLIFEARIRVELGTRRGRVAAFFTYADQPGGTSDELDFEFASNLLNDPSRIDPPCVEGQWVVVNTWNDSQQNPAYVCVEGLDLQAWNTFQIHWLPNRVKWFWVPEGGSRRLLHATDELVPDSPMPVRFNLWACDSGWPEACEPGAVAAATCTEEATDSLDIDYVEIRRQGACGLGFELAFLLPLLRRRHRRRAGVNARTV